MNKKTKKEGKKLIGIQAVANTINFLYEKRLGIIFTEFILDPYTGLLCDTKGEKYFVLIANKKRMALEKIEKPSKLTAGAVSHKELSERIKDKDVSLGNYVNIDLISGLLKHSNRSEYIFEVVETENGDLALIKK